jgi:hypothetical protein
LFLLLSMALFVSLSAFSATAGQSAVRDWTSADGAASFRGTFIEGRGDQAVIVREADGVRFEVALDRLSASDREWIALVLQKREDVASASGDAERTLPDRLEWPRHLRVPSDYQIEVIEEDRASNRFVYRSNHFEFISDVALSRRVIREFGQIFEATYEAVAAMPLRWDPQPPAGPFFKVRLFGDRSAYYAADGPLNSGGVYFGSRREILVPLTSVGMRRTSSEYTFDANADFGTLIHEITHQVHHDWLRRLPIWLTEGLAVYMENVPYARGEFRFDRLNVAGAFSRRSRDGAFVSLTTMIGMSHAEWNQQLANNPERARLNYATAFLMAWFFFHHDADGRNMYRYLRAIEEGMPELEARALLFDGRSLEELERDFIRAFERQRLRLQAG